MTQTTTRQATWATIGTDVAFCNNNVEDILNAAGLNYNVIERPISIDGADDSQSRFKAIIRESDGHVYNIAKQSYTICQNRDAFKFLEEMPEDMQILKAGETDSGMIYLIGKMPEVKILDDVYSPNLIFQNSHNSDFSLTAAIVPLRIICQNQFSAAFANTSNKVSVRHTANIDSNVAQAARVLRETSEYMKAFDEQANRFATQHIKIDNAIEEILPMPKQLTARSEARVEEARQTLKKIHDCEDNQNFKGTAWGLINAITDYTTHSVTTKSKAENRFITSIISPELQKRTLRLITSGVINA